MGIQVKPKFISHLQVEPVRGMNCELVEVSFKTAIYIWSEISIEDDDTMRRDY